MTSPHPDPVADKSGRIQQADGALPVADQWFVAHAVDDALTLIEEPHASPLVQANIWHVRGAARNVLVDCGLGVASLAAVLPLLADDDQPILVLTHAHLDHMGSAHEFVERWGHAAEPFGQSGRGSLRGGPLAEILGLDEELPDLMIDAVPSSTYDPDSYELRPVSLTRSLSDGDGIDLGDRVLTVLHLPGHTPGSIALYDPQRRMLFSGDVVYDDELLDALPESDVPAYLETMRRLSALPVDTVHAGHGASFDGDRLREITADYLRSKTRS